MYGPYKLEQKCHHPNHSSWLSTVNNIINNKSWCPEFYKYYVYLTN